MSFFAHCQENHFVFGRGFIAQRSDNYQKQPFRIFDAEAGMVIFSLSQDTVTKLKPFWSHLCLSEQCSEIYNNKEPSAEDGLPGRHC